MDAMKTRYRYSFESPLTWTEILERLTTEKLYLRKTAYIEVKKLEDKVSFALYQQIESDFGFTFGFYLYPATDHRYPVVTTSDVEGCALLLLPVIALWFLGLTGVTLYHLIHEGAASWQNMQYPWYLFSPFLGIWMLMMLFGNGEGYGHHTIRKTIEPLLRGKLVKEKRQKTMNDKTVNSSAA